MNKGLTPILTIFIIAAMGIMSIPAVNIFNNNEAAPTTTPTASPTSEPTDTPEPTPTSIPTDSPSPSPESTSSSSGSSSSSHVRTETNGVVHDVTVNGNGNYDFDEGGVSIHINNN